MIEELEYSTVLDAVNRGDEKAKTQIAWFLLSGKGGVEKDPDEAVALLEERVKDRDDEAMWMLGICKEYGIGTEKNKNEAKSLYEQSIQNGNDTALLLVSLKTFRDGSTQDRLCQ